MPLSKEAQDVVNRFVDAAEGDINALERIFLRSGVFWMCVNKQEYCDWFNQEDELTCQNCGKPKPKK